MRFRKQASPTAIRTEAASLRWLAEAVTAGGAPVVELLDVGDGWLETRMLEESSPGRAAASEFGRGLAHTHAAGADFWGQPPPGLSPDDARLAELDSPSVGQPRWDTWGSFFAAARLEPYLRSAVDQSALDSSQQQVIERAIARIADGDFDAPQPRLVDGVARIHGDLWAGNVLWARSDDGTQGTLIDPSAHGGHAETDLAELGVFGAPHLDAIIDGYQEASPLADGWRDRVPAHQLHMLVVHVALFGGSYASRAAGLATMLL